MSLNFGFLCYEYHTFNKNQKDEDNNLNHRVAMSIK